MAQWPVGGPDEARQPAQRQPRRPAGGRLARPDPLLRRATHRADAPGSTRRLGHGGATARADRPWHRGRRPAGRALPRTRRPVAAALRRADGGPFGAPRATIGLGDGAATIAAGIAAIVGTVPAGADEPTARTAIRLVMLAGEVAGAEAGPRLTAFSPVAVTPDETRPGLLVVELNGGPYSRTARAATPARSSLPPPTADRWQAVASSGRDRPKARRSASRSVRATASGSRCATPPGTRSSARSSRRQKPRPADTRPDAEPPSTMFSSEFPKAPKSFAGRSSSARSACARSTSPPARGRRGLWLRSLAVELHLGVDPDFRPAGKAHPAFGVADLDTLADRIAAAGHPVRWDAALDERRRFFTDDPVGNRLEFIEAAPAPDRLVAHFSAMARNSAWANDRLLEACEALDAAAFAAPRVSFFPSLRRTLNHLYARRRLLSRRARGDRARPRRLRPRSRLRRARRAPRRPGRRRPPADRLLRPARPPPTSTAASWWCATRTAGHASGSTRCSRTSSSTRSTTAARRTRCSPARRSRRRSSTSSSSTSTATPRSPPAASRPEDPPEECGWQAGRGTRISFAPRGPHAMLTADELAGLKLFAARADGRARAPRQHLRRPPARRGRVSSSTRATARALFVVVDGEVELSKLVGGVERVIGTRAARHGLRRGADGLRHPDAGDRARHRAVAGAAHRAARNTTPSPPPRRSSPRRSARWRSSASAACRASPRSRRSRRSIMLGERWDPACHDLKRFLSAQPNPLRVASPSTIPTSGRNGARRPEAGSCPALRLADGTTLFRPETRALATALGLGTTRQRPRLRHGDHRRRPGRPRRGGLRRLRGPAAPSSSRARRRAARPETSSRIENYLGFPSGISGDELAEPGAAPGAPARRRDPDHPQDHGDRSRRPAPSISTATRRSTPAPSSSPPG